MVPVAPAMVEKNSHPGKTVTPPAEIGALDGFVGVALERGAAQPRMNGGEQALGDWSFGQRQQGRFVERRGGSLRIGVELAHRLDLVAEELDAHRAVGLGGIDVEDAAAPGELAGHLDDVHRGVADAGEMAEQLFDVDLFAAAKHAGEVEIVIRRKEPQGCSLDGRDDDRGVSVGDLPENGGALLLHVGVWGEIFKGQHIVGGEPEHALGSDGAG